MGYLVDTKYFLWYEGGDKRIPAEVREIISSSETEKYLSIASLWEIVIKSSLKKLIISVPLETLMASSIYAQLEIKTSHLKVLHNLPFHHHDPFDRLLIAQALAEGLSIISSDKEFDRYGIERIF